MTIPDVAAGRFSLPLPQGRFDFAFLEKGVVKVELLAPEIDSSLESWLTVPGGLRETRITVEAGTGVVKSEAVSLRYSGQPLQIDFLDRQGRTLLRLSPGGITWKADGSYQITWQKEKGDRYLGLGEPFAGRGPFGGMFSTLALDHNGKKRQIWNRHVPPSDLGLPFFLNPRGYALLVDNPAQAQFDFTAPDSFTYTAAGGPLRFYVFAGDSLYEILAAYSQLTGRPPLPPKWVTGYMQCKYGYQDEKEFRWLMDNFRSRQLPCDVLIFDLDWFAYGQGPEIRMGELKWSPVHFPNALALQKELHRRGFKSIVIVEPYIWQTCSRFAEVRDLNLAARTAGGQPFLFKHWGGVPSLLLDFLNPDTRAWFATRIKEIHQTGVDGWWTDLNEPENDFPDMVFSGKPQKLAHNLQPLLQHQAMAEIYTREFPDERLFIMSRGSFVGDWRFGAGIWSGDVDSSWSHLRQQIPIAISAGLSGWGLWNSDAGGFHGKPSAELYQRWMQFAAFCPLFRAHGDHKPREPWSFGETAERNLRKLLELRYQLSPYLYTTLHEMRKTGKPVIRGLFLEFPHDPKTYEVKDQFMYGPWLLVAPVTTYGARWRRVYLPAGEWTDFWTQQRYEGPKTVWVKAPLDRIPLFVREGAILPLGPVVQYVGEKPLDPLTIHYYHSPHTGSAAKTTYEIYDDDGQTNQYLSGQFSLTTVHIEEKMEAGRRIQIITISRRGSYQGMLEKQNYVLVLHHEEAPEKVQLNDEPLAPSPEPPPENPSPPGWFYDQGQGMIKIFFAARSADSTEKIVVEGRP